MPANAAPPNDTGRELTVDELASAAGTTTRNVRALQTRGVLSSPRLDGRTARYAALHLAELGAVRRLQARGHSLAGIADLLAAWRDGRELQDVVGLPARAPVPEPVPGDVDLDADRFDRLLPWRDARPVPRPTLVLLPGPLAAVLAS